MHRCGGCGLAFIPEGLVVSEHGQSIYEGENPVFLADGNVRYYLDDTNNKSALRKRQWVDGWLSSGVRLLDVGANFGHFLHACKGRYLASGVEISPVAVRWSREDLQVDNHVGSVYEIPEPLKGPWDAITCWDVIEHVPEYRRAIDVMAGLLVPGGHLFVSTPDLGSVVARVMGRHWHYIDPIQHIALFNRENLNRLLNDSGLDIVGWTVFGHDYRVGYVTDRLAYLHRERPWSPLLNAVGRLLRPFQDRVLHINVGDVMGVVARKREV